MVKVSGTGEKGGEVVSLQIESNTSSNTVAFLSFLFSSSIVFLSFLFQYSFNHS